MAAAVSSIKDVLPNCTSAKFSDGKYSLIFRTEHDAAHFDELFGALVKADKLMQSHCELLLPHGPKSRDPSGYALTESWFQVKFDAAFNFEILNKKLAEAYSASSVSKG